MIDLVASSLLWIGGCCGPSYIQGKLAQFLPLLQASKHPYIHTHILPLGAIDRSTPFSKNPTCLFNLSNLIPFRHFDRSCMFFTLRILLLLLCPFPFSRLSNSCGTRYWYFILQLFLISLSFSIPPSHPSGFYPLSHYNPFPPKDRRVISSLQELGGG